MFDNGKKQILLGDAVSAINVMELGGSGWNKHLSLIVEIINQMLGLPIELIDGFLEQIGDNLVLGRMGKDNVRYSGNIVFLDFMMRLSSRGNIYLWQKLMKIWP